MAEIAPWLWQQFSDDNGVPYAGYQVFFYEAGTAGGANTKKNVFTTEVGDVPQANPMDLDNGGMPPTGAIYFDTGAYDMVVAPPGDTDPPVSPVKTLTGLSVTGSSSGIVDTIDDLVDLSEGAFDIVDVIGYHLVTDQIVIRRYYWSSTSTAADNGGTVIAHQSPSATGRWLLKYDDTLNPKWFGAYDDGTQSVITTAAYNALKTVLVTGNIEFTAGSYALDASISTTLTQNLIMHEGASFTAGSAANVTIAGGFEKPLDTAFGTNITAIFTGTGLVTYPQWWGATFDGTTATDEVGIQACINAFKRGNTIKFESASGSFKTSATIYIDTSYVDIDWNYVQCEMTGKAFPALAIGQQANGSASSSGILEPTIRRMWTAGDKTASSVGCILRKCTQVRLYEPHLTGCQYGLQNDGTAGGQESLICSIYDPHFVGNTKGIYDTGGFQGSTFHGGRIEANDEEGVYSDSPNTTFIGTVIEGNGGSGLKPEISLGGGGGMTFSGCYLESQSKTATEMIEIRAASTKELTFSGCYFFANDASGRYIVKSASTSNQTITFLGGIVSDCKNFVSINTTGNSLVSISGVFDNQNNDPVDDLGTTPYFVHTRLNGFATDRKMDLILAENRLNGIGGTYFDGFNSKFTRMLSGDDYPWNETISSFTSGIFYMRKNSNDTNIYMSTDSTNVEANWRKVSGSLGYRKEYTLATDIITLDGATGNVLVDTEADAATDDLWEIAGIAEDGDIIVVQTISSARDVTVHDLNEGGAPGGANIQLGGSNSAELGNSLDSIMLMYQGLSSVWKEISRTGTNTPQDATFKDVGLTGDLDFSTAGKGIKITEGSNAKMGVGTLSSGIATISTTAALTSSRIFISNTLAGSNIYETAIVNATSFSVSDGSGSSGTTFNWIIFDPS